MADDKPVIYVLCGEDEVEINRQVADMQARLGDASLAALNISRLDGQTANLDDLMAQATAIPFMAARRLVIFNNPLRSLNSAPAQQKFMAAAAAIPHSTALVMVEHTQLTNDRDREKGKFHWLEKWALENPGRVYFRDYRLPKGPALNRWIQQKAADHGGEFTPEAAQYLVTLVGEEPLILEKELLKLLDYVNREREVEPEDVELLTADTRQGDVFVLVDALAAKNGRAAIEMLHRLLEEQDAISIFGMFTRQFRLMLLAREILDRGGKETDAVRELKIHPFAAKKVYNQARVFSMDQLEDIYRRLLQYDEAIKTGKLEGETALDLLTAGLTA